MEEEEESLLPTFRSAPSPSVSRSVAAAVDDVLEWELPTLLV